MSIQNTVQASSSSFFASKMSSLDIAETMDKRHKNVIRDIQKLIDEGAIDRLSIEPISYTDSMNRKQPAYSLDFESTMTLITGYDAKRRALVIRRWMDLETGAVRPLAADGEMIPVNRHYFETILKNTNLLEEQNTLLKTLLEEAENRPAVYRPYSKEEDAEILGLLAQGFSHREIGLEIGRSKDSVAKRLYRLRHAQNSLEVNHG